MEPSGRYSNGWKPISVTQVSVPSVASFIFPSVAAASEPPFEEPEFPHPANTRASAQRTQAQVAKIEKRFFMVLSFL